MKIFIPLAEGFEEIEAVTVIDVLRRAGLDVTTFSIGSSINVTGSHLISIKADVMFESADLPNGEMIVLPGGMPGSNNLNEHAGLKNALLDYNSKGKWVCAICAAPLVLGGLDILKDKAATSYPGFEDKLHGADIKTNKVVVSKNTITSRGAGTAMEFSLKIVEIAKGTDTSEKLRQSMLVEA